MSDGPHLDPCDCDECKYAAQGAWGRRNAPTNQPVPLESGADAPTHLPGCFMGDPVTIDRPGLCICDRLRACEARARAAEYSLPEGHPSRDLSYWEAGFAAGIAAAREAVAAEALTDNTGDPADAAYMEGINDALAAIDALRGESDV